MALPCDNATVLRFRLRPPPTPTVIRVGPLWLCKASSVILMQNGRVLDHSELKRDPRTAPLSFLSFPAERKMDHSLSISLPDSRSSQPHQPHPSPASQPVMPTISRHGHVAGQQIAKRLDVLGTLRSGCLGVSWWLVRVLCVAGGAWAMAAIHMSSFSMLVTLIRADFEMSMPTRALTGGIIMLGAFLGAFFFGNLADTRGRKFALLAAFTLAHVAGTCCAAAPSLEVFMILRFVLGVGLGGQQPIICTLVMELAPGAVRGRALVYLSGFSVVGAIAMVLLCRELAPVVGWRALMACNALALLYLPVLYYGMPESPKWLATSGFYHEAVAVLRDIEQQSSVFHSAAADELIFSTPDDASTDGGRDQGLSAIQARKPLLLKAVVDRARVLLQYPYLTRTLVLWVVWMGMAMSETATFVYSGEDFLRDALDGDVSEGLVVYAGLAAQALGNLAAAEFVDRVGRRVALIGFLVAACAGSVFEVYVGKVGLLVLLASCVRSFGQMGAWGCLYTYTPELYPISVRVVGISYAWGISRLGAFAGASAVAVMVVKLQMRTTVVMWIFCALSLLVAVVLAVFGVETAPQRAKEHSPVIADRLTEITGDLVMYAKHEEALECKAYVGRAHA